MKRELTVKVRLAGSEMARLDDLHVLLRHRPLSISRRSAAFHAKAALQGEQLAAENFKTVWRRSLVVNQDDGARGVLRNCV